MNSIAVISPALIAQHNAGYTVEHYTPDHKAEWDAFVRSAKNATFLFERDYLEYHADRFVDYSLMVYHGKKLMALLPGNLNTDGHLVSHGGLTYGGLILSKSVSLLKMMASFHASLRYLFEQGIARLYYSQIPSFYCNISNDDMVFVLFLLNAKIIQRDISVVVNQTNRIPFRKGRKSEISKARRFGVRLVEEFNFSPFWEKVLIPRLARRYGVLPVHTMEEMAYLASKFPENIKQFSAYFGGQIVAGATIYETPGVAHTQYIGVSALGMRTGALDYLINWLIDERYRHKPYFDFGSCKKSDRRTLNYGLLNWKEGFGGRCYSHDIYEIATENYLKLEHPELENKSSLI
jgi:hypothetical protein